MLVTVFMLGFAISPTGIQGFDTNGLAAICHFKNLDVREGLRGGEPQSFYMLFSIIVLFFSYLTRLIKLSARSTTFARRWIREKPRNVLRKGLDNMLFARSTANASLRCSLQYIVIESLYICLRATFDLFGSMLWEVCYERVV